MRIKVINTARIMDRKMHHLYHRFGPIRCPEGVAIGSINWTRIEYYNTFGVDVEEDRVDKLLRRDEIWWRLIDFQMDFGINKTGYFADCILFFFLKRYISALYDVQCELEAMANKAKAEGR
ncbi:MAG TPA: hypothetical protein VM577_04720 [Anaerovoracaceae bacterium]|nr:hypothetical protein [Anaerovoracaceae bacterium]